MPLFLFGEIGLRGLDVWVNGVWVQCGALAMVSRGTGPWMGGEQKWRAGSGRGSGEERGRLRVVIVGLSYRRRYPCGLCEVAQN